MSTHHHLFDPARWVTHWGALGGTIEIRDGSNGKGAARIVTALGNCANLSDDEWRQIELLESQLRAPAWQRSVVEYLSRRKVPEASSKLAGRSAY